MAPYARFVAVALVLACACSAQAPQTTRQRVMDVFRSTSARFATRAPQFCQNLTTPAIKDTKIVAQLALAALFASDAAYKLRLCPSLEGVWGGWRAYAEGQLKQNDEELQAVRVRPHERSRAY